MMDFTFGIITSGEEDERINQVIDSIEKQNIPNYEIIIVGNSKVVRDKTEIIEFDENIVPVWITKKKNIITSVAQFENIVYLHDYVKFEDDWYEGFLKFGNDFDLCMNVILNHDDTRFRDWQVCMWTDPRSWDVLGYEDPLIASIVGPYRRCLIPYEESRLVKHMYFSGTYWVAKKKLMLEFPLNESLSWCQGEDVEWSIRVREHYNFSMNKYSTVKLLKYKDVIFTYADSEIIEKLVENCCLVN